MKILIIPKAIRLILFKLFFIFAGISVRVSGEGDKLMHHKFCLIDGTSNRGLIITGSLNWTYGVSCYLCDRLLSTFK